MTRYLPILAVLALPVAAVAQSDELTKSPYLLTIALHVEEHPLHTEQFIDRLQKEIGAAVRRELGKAAEVEVVGQHPLLDDVLKQDWPALDRTHPVDERKVHLLRVRQQDGEYLVQGRQVDAWTGYVSPLRQEAVADRERVARLAAAMVVREFGPTGVVSVKDKAIKLRGATLSNSAALKAEPGEVFAIVQVQQGRDRRQQAYRVPDSVLYVLSSREGVYHVRLFERFENSLAEDRHTLEFRVIKLATRQLTPRVRILDARDGNPLKNIGVAFSRNGEYEKPPAGDRSNTDEQGRTKAKEKYRHVVFIQPTIAGQDRAPVPVPLVDDRPIEIRLSGTREAEAFAQFRYKYLQWEKKAVSVRSQVDKDFKEITNLYRAEEEKQAAEKANGLAKRIRDDVTELRAALAEVAKASSDAGAAAQALLKIGDGHLAALDTQLKSLEDIVQFVENPTAAQKLIKQARLLEEVGDAEPAIAAYKKAAAFKDDPFAKAAGERLQQLEQAWKIKGRDHRSAREWLSAKWDRLEWDMLEQGLELANESFTDFEKAGDFLSVRRLARINTRHSEKLAEVLGTLNPQTNSKDAEKANQIARTAEGLAKLNQKIAEYLARVE